MAIIEGELWSTYPIDISSPQTINNTFILDGWYMDTRCELLITCDDMYELGFGIGEVATITELRFYQTSIGATITNVQVAMLNTTETELTGNTFTPISTMIYVMQNATFNATPTAGWVSFVFDNPFEWDGVSNILVTLVKDRTSYDNSNTTQVRTSSYNFYKGYRDDSNATYPFETGTSGMTSTYLVVPRTYIVADTSPISPTIVAPNTPTSLTPVNGYLSNTRSVQFGATLTDNEDVSLNDKIRLVIETSSNPNSFTNVFTSSAVDSGNTATVNVTFPSNGTYFWRAKAIDRSGLESGYTPIRSMIVDNLPPQLTNISPSANTIVAVNNFTISATATDSNGVNNIEYEVYRELAMTTKVANGTLNYLGSNNYSINIIGASIMQGNYYWRIRVFDNSGEISAWTNLRGVFINIATTGRLSLDGTTALTNITVSPLSILQDDPDSPDGNWATIPSNTASMSMRATFPTPPRNLKTGAGLQEFRVLTRKSLTSSTSNPTLTLALYEGSSKATGSPFTVTTTTNTGQVASFTWDASLLSAISGANVEVLITGSLVGSGGTRTTTNIGAIEWNYQYVTETQVTSPTDSTPAVITGLSATPSDTSIYLSWTKPSDADLYCTEVYRDNVLIYTLSPSITSFTDVGLSSSTTYAYKFITVDVVGGKSSPVTTSSTTTTATPVTPSVNIVSVDKYKISGVSGSNISHVVFTFDRNVTQWEVRIGGSGQGTGFLADSGGAVTTGTQVTATIDRTELSVEGQNKVNIYGLNATGWTPYQ